MDFFYQNSLYNGVDAMNFELWLQETMINWTYKRDNNTWGREIYQGKYQLFKRNCYKIFSVF